MNRELEAVGITAEITGRAKHFYSIYEKMTRRGKEFNEIYDLTAMRVLVDSVKDCYGAVGIIHSLWKPGSCLLTRRIHSSMSPSQARHAIVSTTRFFM